VQPDASASECTFPQCHLKFNLFHRRHHCRKCGKIFCDPHSPPSLRLNPKTLQYTDNTALPLVRGCPSCYLEYQDWLINKPTRQNSFGSDTLGREEDGISIRKNSDRNRMRYPIFANLYQDSTILPHRKGRTILNTGRHSNRNLSALCSVILCLNSSLGRWIIRCVHTLNTLL
jgi:hypothetical protein